VSGPAVASPTLAGASAIRIGFQVWSQFCQWDELMAAGVAIEQAGFHSLWANDHFVPAVGGKRGAGDLPRGPVFEGWIVLAGWATRTRRVELGSLVSGVGYRNPALLVKMATALDHLSGGRANLGLGAGWLEVEHRAFGFAFPSLRERLDRLEEAAAICRGLLDGESVTFDGRWYRAAGAVNDPPPRRGRLPLVVGGSGERRTLAIVARYADVWSADGGDPETLAHKGRALDAHCRRAGRDPATVRRTCGQPPVLIRRSRQRAVAELAAIYRHHGVNRQEATELASRSPFASTVDVVAGRLWDLARVGMEEVVFDWPAPFDQATLDALAGPVQDLLRQWTLEGN
jgi:F420-dependent oxidoreductase-like protein